MLHFYLSDTDLLGVHLELLPADFHAFEGGWHGALTGLMVLAWGLPAGLIDRMSFTAAGERSNDFIIQDAREIAKPLSANRTWLTGLVIVRWQIQCLHGGERRF